MKFYIIILNLLKDIQWKSDLWKNKMGILPSWGCVSTTVGLQLLDFNKTPGEKAKWELHKGAACCFEQTLQNSSCTAINFPSHKSSKMKKTC